MAKHDEFAARLQSAMDRRGMSVRELIFETRSTDAMAYKWVRGDARPNTDYLVKIGRALGVSVEWLVTGEDAAAAAESAATPLDLAEELRTIRGEIGATDEELAFLQRIDWGGYEPTLQTLTTIIAALRLSPHRYHSNREWMDKQAEVRERRPKN